MTFKTKLNIHNPTAQDRDAIIYAGTVFEVKDPFSGVQNLGVAKTTSVSIPAGGTQIVEIESWCLNRNSKPPSGNSMQPTSLMTKPYTSQASAWNDLDGRI